MMKDEKPLLCRKDFTASARGNIKQEQEVNSSSEGEYVIGPRPWRVRAGPRIEQAEGRRPIISGAAHGDPDQPAPPTVCDMDIWILDMLLAEAAMDVIGSDEGFRRAVPHQEGGLTRHGSMAATDAQTIRFELMIT